MAIRYSPFRARSSRRRCPHRAEWWSCAGALWAAQRLAYRDGAYALAEASMTLEQGAGWLERYGLTLLEL
jgi:hypothetical protein